MNNSRLILTVAALAPALLSAETLVLSLDSAVAAALDRNFTVQVEAIDPQVAQQAARGVAGTFDPELTGEYASSRTDLQGFEATAESERLAVSVGSTLPWGTRVQAEVEADDLTTPFDSVEGGPFEGVRSFAGIVVTQPLLRGFGAGAGSTDLAVARQQAEIASERFRASVMDVVERTVQAYQQVYFEQENLRIALRNRDLARKLLKDNRKRVETGVMAPLDIVQAESEAALREVSVISAQASLRQALNAMKQLIWDDPETVLDLEISILPPPQPVRAQVDTATDLRTAIELRPEMRLARLSLDIRERQLRQLRRNALPQLDLVASYGQTGTADELGDSLDAAFNNGRERYTVGAVVSMPIFNRTRNADKVSAYLLRNQEELRTRQTEQLIRLEVDDAITQMEADWDRIQAARTARQLAEKSLEAEEKKLRAGTSTTFVVLRLQGDLAVAEIREINALADYAISLAAYHRARGTLLEAFKVALHEN